MRRPGSGVLRVSEPSRGAGMPLRTLIVDDEPIARRVLREELDCLDGVEIVGEAENGAIALAKISEYHPDLVLLDLQMPGMGGLEVVRNLRRGAHMPVIVVVTAYDQYALQAFEAGGYRLSAQAGGRNTSRGGHRTGERGHGKGSR